MRAPRFRRKALGTIRLGRWAPFVALLVSGAAFPQSSGELPAARDLVPIYPENLYRLKPIWAAGRSRVLDLLWSPDGGYLALRTSLGSSFYRFREAGKTPRLERVRSPLAGVSSSALALGQNASLATSDGSPRITLWNLKTGARLGDVATSGSAVVDAALAPDAPLLAAVTADAKLFLWATERLKDPPRVLDDPLEGVAGVRIGPRGELAATWASRNEAHLWDVPSGKLELKLDLRRGQKAESVPVGPVLFAARGLHLWAVADRSIRRFSLPGGEELSEVPLKYPLFTQGCAHPSGTHAVLQGEKGPEIQEVEDQRALLSLGEVGYSWAAAYRPGDGTSLAFFTGASLQIVSAQTGNVLVSEDLSGGLGSPCSLAAVSPDGGWMAWGDDTSDLKLRDLAQGGKPKQLAAADRLRLMRLALSPEGKYVAGVLGTGSREPLLWLWKVQAGRLQPVAGLDSVRRDARSAAFSPDGRWLAFGTQWRTTPQVHLLELKTGKVTPVSGVRGREDSRGSLSPVACLAFDSRSKYLAIYVMGYQGVQIAEVEKQRVTAQLSPSEKAYSFVTSMAFRPGEGNLLAANAGSQILLYDTEKRQVSQTIELEDHRADQLAFSPDGRLLAVFLRQGAVTAQGALGLIDVASGRLLQRLPSGLGWTNSMAFASDGRIIVCGSYAGSVQAWGISARLPAVKEKAKAK